MAALNNVSIPLGSTAPTNLDPAVWTAINDIHIAFQNLVAQLNGTFPVMMSPNGHFWKATINNSGAVTWTDVGTVHP